VTTFASEKRTVRVCATVLDRAGFFASAAGEEISAYEIHMGSTVHRGEAAFRLGDGGWGIGDRDGCVVAGGALMGTYLHGLFENRCIRAALVNWMVERRGLPPFKWEETVRRRDADYDRLAEALRSSLDLPALYRIAGLGGH
jgi:adenosylcobyric acid synthase